GYDFGPDRSRELRSFGLFVGFGVAALAATGTAAVVLLRRPVGKSGAKMSFTVGPSSASLVGSF
ncbi:MAG TPA: hypothetical protein VHB21_08345, partial [Minicystis sp.]|nr:hypothetical protein [Minicystis sp.]